MASCFRFLLHLCSIYTLQKCISAQDVYGCGGFVKFDVEIKFSLIEVKLYTKQGSLKYQTECAVTGYFMIPVYDKGDYILKVEAPNGWTFEPNSYTLHIDGENDKCSLGEDINFQFTGFGVIGKVCSKGSTSGPAEVQVHLKNLKNEEIQTVKTLQGGQYRIDKVLPGDYILEATHPTFTFSKSTSTVTVGTETAQAKEDIVIAGYSVKGNVLSNEEAVKGVQFMLYSKTVKGAENCDPSGLSDGPISNGLLPLCHVSSKEDGYFSFPTLSPGEYWIMPVYKNARLKFDVQPIHQEFTVEHAHLTLPMSFHVAGFSVSGKVVAYLSGPGVPNAIIKVNGKRAAESRADGSFSLESVISGNYEIDVEDPAKKLYFDTTTLKISPQTPELPEILASRYSVCGLVNLHHFPKGLNKDLSTVRVLVQALGNTAKLTQLELDNDGNFCSNLYPGNYSFSVDLGTKIQSRGLKVTPGQQFVLVHHGPVSGIEFQQVLLTISGQVVCLEVCPVLSISLSATEILQEKRLTEIKIEGNRGFFEFEKVLPGKYKVIVLSDDWCYDKKVIDVHAMEHPIPELKFTHVGYIMNCEMSHGVEVKYHLADHPELAQKVKWTRGSNQMCVPKPGVYHFTPISCHQFDQDVYKFDTAKPTLLVMNAFRHLIPGVIVSPIMDDITVSIMPQAKGQLTVVPAQLIPTVATDQDHAKDNETKESNKTPSSFTYRFHHWALAWEDLVITPNSSKLLFSPPLLAVTVSGDVCFDGELTFEAKAGLFIEGNISPALAGVTITMLSRPAPSEDPEVYEFITDKKGLYLFGPMHPDGIYEVKASKDGYVFSPTPANPYNFQAFKLAEIHVQVLNTEGHFLPGVLLSLSKQNFRNNSISGDSGYVTFLNLGPGQYFLKPILKEFTFKPDAQLVNVTEGGTLEVKITGSRVAYSCYGAVTSLNGEPEAGVFVEAFASGEQKNQCFDEQAKTEHDGGFRIRGLKPECQYILRVCDNTFNPGIDRWFPSELSVQVINEDVTGVLFMALRSPTQLQTDVVGFVDASPEDLNSLQVILSKDEDPDNPVQTTYLHGSSMFYFSSLLRNSKMYTVQVWNTLTVSDNNIHKQTKFFANTSLVQLSLHYETKPSRSTEQELIATSFMVLPITVLVVLLVYNYNKVWPVVVDAVKPIVSGIRNMPLVENLLKRSSPQPSTDFVISPELLKEFSSMKTINRKKKPKKA